MAGNRPTNGCVFLFMGHKKDRVFQTHRRDYLSGLDSLWGVAFLAERKRRCHNHPIHPILHLIMRKMTVAAARPLDSASGPIPWTGRGSNLKRIGGFGLLFFVSLPDGASGLIVIPPTDFSPFNTRFLSSGGPDGRQSSNKQLRFLFLGHKKDRVCKTHRWDSLSGRIHYKAGLSLPEGVSEFIVMPSAELYPC